MREKMKKILFLTMIVLSLLTLPMAASATTFTMDATQLQALYETYENPNSVGTYLSSPIGILPDGAKFTGAVRTNETGDGQIQIGANFWGVDFNRTSGAKIGDLGMNDLSGYNAYGLNIENANENVWDFNVYFNAGWTDSPYGETNYYVQNTWTSIAVGASADVLVDFTNAQVWGGGYDGDWVDITNISELNLAHVTNIGLNIGGSMPLPGSDYTYEVKVRSIPDLSAVFLLGSACMLGGFAGFRRKFKK